MRFLRRTRWTFSLLSGGFAVIALLTCAMTAVADEQPSPIPGLSQREALHLGERMYREGILPSGEPINAIVQGDIPILGRITTGEWKPIHEFCEKHHLPSIYPITDFPVISETDWFTLYFSKGLYQEEG